MTPEEQKKFEAFVNQGNIKKNKEKLERLQQELKKYSTKLENGAISIDYLCKKNRWDDLCFLILNDQKTHYNVTKDTILLMLPSLTTNKEEIFHTLLEYYQTYHRDFNDDIILGYKLLMIALDKDDIPSFYTVMGKFNRNLMNPITFILNYNHNNLTQMIGYHAAKTGDLELIKNIMSIRGVGRKQADAIIKGAIDYKKLTLLKWFTLEKNQINYRFEIRADLDVAGVIKKIEGNNANVNQDRGQVPNGTYAKMPSQTQHTATSISFKPAPNPRPNPPNYPVPPTPNQDYGINRPPTPYAEMPHPKSSYNSDYDPDFRKIDPETYMKSLSREAVLRKSPPPAINKEDQGYDEMPSPPPSPSLSKRSEYTEIPSGFKDIEMQELASKQMQHMFMEAHATKQEVSTANNFSISNRQSMNSTPMNTSSSTLRRSKVSENLVGFAGNFLRQEQDYDAPVSVHSAIDKKEKAKIEIIGALGAAIDPDNFDALINLMGILQHEIPNGKYKSYNLTAEDLHLNAYIMLAEQNNNEQLIHLLNECKESMQQQAVINTNTPAFVPQNKGNSNSNSNVRTSSIDPSMNPTAIAMSNEEAAAELKRILENFKN